MEIDPGLDSCDALQSGGEDRAMQCKMKMDLPLSVKSNNRFVS